MTPEQAKCENCGANVQREDEHAHDHGVWTCSAPAILVRAERLDGKAAEQYWRQRALAAESAHAALDAECTAAAKTLATLRAELDAEKKAHAGSNRECWAAAETINRLRRDLSAQTEAGREEVAHRNAEIDRLTAAVAREQVERATVEQVLRDEELAHQSTRDMSEARYETMQRRFVLFVETCRQYFKVEAERDAAATAQHAAEEKCARLQRAFDEVVARGGEKDRTIADYERQLIARDNERHAAEAREREVRAAVALDAPFSLPSVLEHLIAAVAHLFEHHGCDGHGWEVWHAAHARAKELLPRLVAALAPPPRNPDAQVCPHGFAIGAVDCETCKVEAVTGETTHAHLRRINGAIVDPGSRDPLAERFHIANTQYDPPTLPGATTALHAELARLKSALVTATEKLAASEKAAADRARERDEAREAHALDLDTHTQWKREVDTFMADHKNTSWGALYKQRDDIRADRDRLSAELDTLKAECAASVEQVKERCAVAMAERERCARILEKLEQHGTAYRIRHPECYGDEQ
jgi:hypothetical protein